MKILFLFFLSSILYLLSSSCARAQSGEWTWMKGDSTGNVAAVFGTQGIPDASNKPPGIYEPCEWRDHQGNLWLYGGSNGIAFANLWKYDPLTNEWTWMHGPGNGSAVPVYGTQGVASPLNTPGSRAWGAGSWVDTAGNFWLFGGSSTSGNFNDLWKYDPSINEWAWMKGFNGTGGSATYGTQGVADPANSPGARRECAATWVDSLNRLWIFGGEGKTNSSDGLLNDLWRYDVATNEWAWVRGANTINPAGNYGTITVSDPGNDPPGRNAFGRWIDHQGNFWLFGGGSYAAGYAYNDLWRYSLQANEWTWMNGTNQTDNSGVYGSYCIQFDSTYPKARFENRLIWSDLSHCSMWLFGGRFNASQYTLSDFWHFDATTNKFTLVSGSSATNADGFYGTQTVYNPANYPGNRGGGVSWTDLNGSLWMYGGWSASNGYLNDLWKCELGGTCPGIPNCGNPPIANFNCSDTSICQSACVDFTSLSFNNPTSWVWSFPGGNPSSSTVENPINICYAASGTYDVVLIVSNNSGSDTIMMSNFVTVALQAIAIITQSNDTLFSSSGNSYQWYAGGSAINGATDNFYVPSTVDFYSVVITDSTGCTAADTIFFSFVPQTYFSASDTLLCQKFCMDFFDQSNNNPISWQWQFPGGDPSSSTDQNPINICYDIPGTYDVTLITTSASGNDTLTLPNYITVYPTPPFPTITQVDYTLTSSLSTSYQWQFNATDIPGATNQSYTVLQTGYYTVVVGDSNSCKNSATIYVLISGVDDVSSGANISIYPNPATNGLMVELLNGFVGDEISISILNTLGQEIFSSQQKIPTIDWREEINLNEVASGIYFIQIKSQSVLFRKKIIVAK